MDREARHGPGRGAPPQPRATDRLASHPGSGDGIGAMLFERAGAGAPPHRTRDWSCCRTRRPCSQPPVRFEERSGTHDAVQGTIRLGVPETFAVVCLPKLIDLLSREHPALRLELDIATSATLTQHVEDRHIDLAFVANPEDNPRLRLLPLGQHEFGWIAHAQLEVIAAGPTGRPAPPADHQQPSSVATVPRDRRLVPKRRAGAAAAQLLQQRERDRAPGRGRRRDQRPASAHGRSTRSRPAG